MEAIEQANREYAEFVDSLYDDAPIVLMREIFDGTIRCFSDGRVEKLYKTGLWGEVSNTPNLHGRYNAIRVNGKTITRHKLLGACFLNHPLTNRLPIDHKNGVFLDNRVSNLRSSTYKNNGQNTNSKCYSWHSRDQKWRVRLVINNKSKFCGNFANEADAKARAIELKLIHYPEFRPRHEYNLAHGL